MTRSSVLQAGQPARDCRRIGPHPSRLAAGRNFYVGMGVTVAVVVGVGFGRTFSAGLVHPASARPAILYFHAAMFTAWVVLFIAQAALVRLRRVVWHRRLGTAGFILGGLMPVVGIRTALVMSPRTPAGEAFLIVSCFDMLAFTIAFWLAVYWRRRPEYHRRAMLIASCGLTVAAFARFPAVLMPYRVWYACVDALIVSGAARDWMVTGRVHRVYLYGLPLLAVGQVLTMWIYVIRPPIWLAIAHALLA